MTPNLAHTLDSLANEFQYDPSGRWGVETVGPIREAARIIAGLEKQQPTAYPDECAANGNGHNFGPHGPGAAMQCAWCGESRQPAASGEPADDPHAYSRRCAAAEFERGPWDKHAVAQPAPAPADIAAKPVAWLRSDGMKAMTADEKDAWLEAGRDDLVADYTIPLVAG